MQTAKCEIVKLADYTPEIHACVERLRDRMEHTCTGYVRDDILVVGDGAIVFVLANPLLGEERMYDDRGRVKKLIPMRNITLIYYDGPPEAGMPEHEFKLLIRLPRLRVLRPDLCLKIVGGQVIECRFAGLERLLSTLWSPGSVPVIGGGGRDANSKV